MTLSASKNLSMMKALEGHFLKAPPVTFPSLIFEKGVYYNHKLVRGYTERPTGNPVKPQLIRIDSGGRIVMHISVLKTRVDALLAMAPGQGSVEQLNELYPGALGIMAALYGTDSSQEKALKTYVEALRNKGNPFGSQTIDASFDATRGILLSIKAELDSGFIGSLCATLTGEVLTDFIKLGRATLEESGDGAKNVAAVLIAAAFEDVLRRIADLKSVPHMEKLADVFMALKELGILQGAEVGIAQSYLSFRNRSLHAQWDEVDRPAIESVLGFIEQMILKHLT